MRNPHRTISPASRAWISDQLSARQAMRDNLELGTGVLVNRALDAGMTYAEVAACLGISRSSLYNRYVITERELPF